MDDGKGLQVVNMTGVSSTLYTYTFTNFASNVTVLNYTVVGVDIFGNQLPLGKDRSIVIFPAMPAWDMSGAEEVVVIVIALIVGVVCGAIYSSMVRGKPTLRQLTLAEKKRLDEIENQRQGNAPPFWAARGLTATITMVVIGGLLTLAILAVITFNYATLSMWFFAGLFLATTFLWVLVTDAVVVKTLRSGQVKIGGGAMVLVLGVGFSIFITLLAILFVGNTVTWWQVRVNQAAYNIMGITIPKMLTSLASAFFTSIIVLSWTVGKDVTRKASELHEQELNHANPGLLLEHREDALSQIQGAVGMKAVIFIAVIGVTVIFASDLSIYTTQGLFIIVPFVLGTFLIIALHAFWQKIKPQEAGDVLFDHVTTCPACGAETAVGGLYCEHCGAKVIAGTRVIEGRECLQCGFLNPSNGMHCRYCGSPLEEASGQDAVPPRGDFPDLNDASA
jgi:ribosomal protein L40E